MTAVNFRPYPDIGRAHRQVKRHPEPPACPLCDHLVRHHALEDGQPVCTRGPGRVACRDCAETYARMPVIGSMLELGALLNRHPSLMTLTSGKQGGKNAAMRQVEQEALARGEHVHRASGADGIRCLGGDTHCRTPRAGMRQ